MDQERSNGISSSAKNVYLQEVMSLTLHRYRSHAIRETARVTQRLANQV